jgi:hypothetical protein
MNTCIHRTYEYGLHKYSYVKSKKEWVGFLSLEQWKCFSTGMVWTDWVGSANLEGRYLTVIYGSTMQQRVTRFFTGFLTAQLMRAFTSILATVISYKCNHSHQHQLCLPYFHISFHMHKHVLVNLKLMALKNTRRLSIATT